MWSNRDGSNFSHECAKGRKESVQLPPCGEDLDGSRSHRTVVLYFPLFKLVFHEFQQFTVIFRLQVNAASVGRIQFELNLRLPILQGKYFPFFVILWPKNRPILFGKVFDIFHKFQNRHWSFSNRIQHSITGSETKKRKSN